MIFPDHCKVVGVASTNSHEEIIGTSIYFLTEYVLQFVDDSCMIFKVENEGEGFIRKITKVELIASCEETTIWDDIVDLSNRKDLIKTAGDIVNDQITTVVFKGYDMHYSFINNPDDSEVLNIQVLDVVPPNPPYLLYNLERLEKAGILGELNIEFEPMVLDLKDYEDRDVMFPCSVSGLNGNFLDQGQVPSNKSTGEKIILVGCDVSYTVLCELDLIGTEEIEHINICPINYFRPTKPFLVRCCIKDRGGIKEVNGEMGMVVHWGATPIEIMGALRDLCFQVRDIEKKKD